MNKSNNNEQSAQTEADSNSTAENQQVSQPNANTNVVGSLLGQREIKFRGKRVDNGEWVYGDLIQYSKTECKILEQFYRQWDILEGGYDIIPESAGQYTGLKDKNGKEIYEGDILNGRNRVLKIVYWCEKRAAFCESEQFKPIPAKHSFAKLYDKFGKVFNKDGRLENHFIVGNIFENPELL